MSNHERNYFGQRPSIVLTSLDRDALFALLSDPSMITDVAAARFLREEIERADIAPDDVLPNSVVQIGCYVKFVDHADARIRRAQIVLPEDGLSTDRISVLSCTGSALIGLGPGQSIRWTEYGNERSLAVLEVSTSRLISNVRQNVPFTTPARRPSVPTISTRPAHRSACGLVKTARGQSRH